MEKEFLRLRVCFRTKSLPPAARMVPHQIPSPGGKVSAKLTDEECGQKSGIRHLDGSFAYRVQGKKQIQAF